MGKSLAKKKGIQLVLKIIVIIISGNLFQNCENSVSPQKPIENYQLCYKKLVGGDWEILLNDISGSNPQIISDSTFDNSSPNYSPTGKYIAYSGDTDEGADIVLYSSETKTNKIVRNSLSDESFRAWTADGENILYQNHIIGQFPTINVMGKNGSNKRIVVDKTGRVYTHFDGHTFLFSDFDEYILMRMDIHSAKNEYLVDLREINSRNPTCYDYNPIEEKILILQNKGDSFNCILAEYHLLTGLIDTLMIADSNITFIKPQYSNDFTKIVLSEKDYLEEKSWLVLFDYTNRTTLVELEKKSWFHFSPMSFSDDDKYIAYGKSINNDGSAWFTTELYVVEIESRKSTFIDDGQSPNFIKNNL